MLNSKEKLSYLKNIEKNIFHLQQKLRSAKAEGFVVNISGGVDSAVVLRLVQLALPKNKKLKVLFLPCNNDKIDFECVSKLATRFNFNYQQINIKNCLDLIVKSQRIILKNCEIKEKRKIIGNIAARLRMTYAYLYSNRYNLLVIGTTNFSEYTLGYGTKFGDCASDFNPIINLQKYEVWHLAVLLGVPKIIINRAPSAGLWSGQTDESELGFTYEQVKKFLNNVKINENFRLKIEERIRKNKHKAEGIESSLLTN